MCHDSQQAHRPHAPWEHCAAAARTFCGSRPATGRAVGHVAAGDSSTWHCWCWPPLLPVAELPLPTLHALHTQASLRNTDIIEHLGASFLSALMQPEKQKILILALLEGHFSTFFCLCFPAMLANYSKQNCPVRLSPFCGPAIPVRAPRSPSPQDGPLPQGKQA